MKTLEELKKEVQLKLELKNKEEESKKLKEKEYIKSEEYKQEQIEFEARKQKIINESLAVLNSQIEKCVDVFVSGSLDREKYREITFCDFNCKYPAYLSDVENKLKELGYIFKHESWEGAELSTSYSYITIDTYQFFQK